MRSLIVSFLILISGIGYAFGGAVCYRSDAILEINRLTAEIADAEMTYTPNLRAPDSSAKYRRITQLSKQYCTVVKSYPQANQQISIDYGCTLLIGQLDASGRTVYWVKCPQGQE